MVTFDLGRVTTVTDNNEAFKAAIVVTFDLGRVTTYFVRTIIVSKNCGDVRSRTSYNFHEWMKSCGLEIVVTFDLGRVTTLRAHEI